jgi:Transglutaminase-like superfamily
VNVLQFTIGLEATVINIMKGLTIFTIARTSRVLLSLFAVQNASSNKSDSRSDGSVIMIMEHNSACRSNATHIVWQGVSLDDNASSLQSSIRKERRRHLEADEATSLNADNNSPLPTYCSVQTRKEAEQDCLKFLQENIMGFDEPFRETMGFPDANDDTADGLDYGLIQPTIRLALDAKVQYPWTDALPRDIFMDYVLNYANLNEARTNWRPLLVESLRFNESDLSLSGRANISSVTTWVNTHLWTKLARNKDRPIFFKSSQTPLIFDPMSTIAFGYASCTGTSILFCNALRSVGIPARVAGTPAWYGNATQGNHNWVEVYVGKSNNNNNSDDNNNNDDGWKFLEPSPALPNVDTLDSDPCERWFCDPSRYPSSKVYAAKMTRAADDNPSKASHFPLAWEWDCKDVPAVDRTDYYTKICGSCRKEE